MKLLLLKKDLQTHTNYRSLFKMYLRWNRSTPVHGMYKTNNDIDVDDP